MSRKLRFLFKCSVLSLVLGVLSMESGLLKSQDAPKKVVPDEKHELDQAAFMRKKLEASSQVLEGLTTENASLIVQGARVLAEMSNTERWNVKHDAIYRQFSGEFQRSATGLLEAAEKNNFDAAALKWIDTTMKCIECHRFVRGDRVVSTAP